MLTLIFAGVLSAGAFAGLLVLSRVSEAVRAAVLAFGAAAMLYLVTEELLVEAHEGQEAPGAVLVLFAGFMAFWALRMAAP